MDYIHLWGIPSGTNDTERRNRNANLVRRCPVWRAPIEIHPSGNFDPNAGNVILQHGWSYASAFAAAAEAGYEVLLCFMIHATGDWDGDGYHRSRPPVLDPNKVARFVGQFNDWLAVTHPNLRRYGWSLGNEVDYSPTGHYTHEKWWACFERIRHMFPSNLKRVSGGNSGREEDRGNLTHNGWLARTGKAKDHNIILDVHGNHLSDHDFREELRELPNRYPGVKTGCYEDNPDGDNNRALARAKVAKAAGAVAHAVFGARDSGNPPLTTCRWGTGSNKPHRPQVGLEGCGRKWQDGTHGTVDNWSEITKAAKHLGTFVAGRDLPNYVESEEPPGPPPPPEPPGPPEPPAPPPTQNQFLANAQKRLDKDPPNITGAIQALINYARNKEGEL